MLTRTPIFSLHWCAVFCALSLLLGALPSNAQILRVIGNDKGINSGDTTPSLSDHTSFGTVQLNSPPVDREFTLRNIGFSPLTLTAFVSTNPINFTFIESPNRTIPSNGGETTLKIRFLAPQTGGQRLATVRIFSDSQINPIYEFVVSGELILPAPKIEVLGDGNVIQDGSLATSPSNLTSYGSLGINGGSQKHTFSIKNTGDLALDVDLVTVTGINSDQFSVTNAPDLPVLPNEEDTFEITYAPSRTGLHRATVQINSNDPDPTKRPYTFTISGTGTLLAPELTLIGNGNEIANGDDTPAPEDHTEFPATDVESTSLRNFVLKNTGDSPLTITSIEVIDLHAAEFSVSDPPANSIPPGEEASLAVRFTPSRGGPRGTTLRIVSNSSTNPEYLVALAGTGGRFKLLGIEIDGDDALINFVANPELGTYIYRIQYSTDLQNWSEAGSLISTGRETRQFRHPDIVGEEQGFWRVEEQRLE